MLGLDLDLDLYDIFGFELWFVPRVWALVWICSLDLALGLDLFFGFHKSTK